MLPNNANIHFTRLATRAGWFNWPPVVFTLSHADSGSPIGQFTVRTGRAEFVAADGRESFRLRRGFWGLRWLYEGDDGQPFARVSYGFGRPAITFPDDNRYRMLLRRRWNIFRRLRAGEYEHLATFLREDTPVMVLKNSEQRQLFASELSMPMSGDITTTLSDIRQICGMLLLFQVSIVRRRAAAAAA